MPDVQTIAAAIAGLSQLGEIPAELASGTPFQTELDDGRSVGVAYNARAGQWLLGVAGGARSLKADAQAALNEAALRRSFDSRYTDGIVAAIDEDGRMCLSVLRDALPDDAVKTEWLFEYLLREFDRWVGEAGSTAAPNDSAGPPAHWMGI